MSLEPWPAVAWSGVRSWKASEGGHATASARLGSWGGCRGDAQDGELSGGKVTARGR